MAVWNVVLKSALGERNEAHGEEEKNNNRVRTEGDKEKKGASLLFSDGHRLLHGQFFLIYFFPVGPVRGSLHRVDN